MRRAYVISLIVVGVVLFLIISALLARVLSVDGTEQSATTELIQAEARGDQAGMLDRLKGCRQSQTCRARVAYDVATLTRPGSISILTYQQSAGFSLTSTTGTARVAWKTPSSLPIVQCLRVRRAGDVFTGLHIELLTISTRIKSDADCPARY
jgi:hypothetical protein